MYLIQQGASQGKEVFKAPHKFGLHVFISRQGGSRPEFQRLQSFLFQPSGPWSDRKGSVRWRERSGQPAQRSRWPET